MTRLGHAAVWICSSPSCSLSPCPCLSPSQPAEGLGAFLERWCPCLALLPAVARLEGRKHLAGLPSSGRQHLGLQLPKSYPLGRGGWSLQAKPYVRSPWQKGRVLGLPKLPAQSSTPSAAQSHLPPVNSILASSHQLFIPQGRRSPTLNLSFHPGPTLPAPGKIPRFSTGLHHQDLSQQGALLLPSLSKKDKCLLAHPHGSL